MVEQRGSQEGPYARAKDVKKKFIAVLDASFAGQDAQDAPYADQDTPVQSETNWHSLKCRALKRKNFQSAVLFISYQINHILGLCKGLRGQS